LVEKIFAVRVVKVNTHRGKRKRRGTANRTRTQQTVKRAFVTLAKGERIVIFPNTDNLKRFM
jgi:ribosomal protein L23